MPRLRTLTTVAAAVLALAGGGLAAAPHPAEARPGQAGGNAWFTSWAQSQQDAATDPLRDQSVRTVTHLSQGGYGVRVRIQNTFGTAPLEIGGASVGLSGDGASIKGDTHPVRFGGKTHVTVPAGGEVWSDRADLDTAAQDDVAVSVALKGAATPGQHRTALRTNYLTPEGTGDHTADTTGAAYTKTVDATYLVSAVDVHNPASRAARSPTAARSSTASAAPTAAPAAPKPAPTAAGPTTWRAACTPNSRAPTRSRSPTRASAARRARPTAPAPRRT